MRQDGVNDVARVAMPFKFARRCVQETRHPILITESQVAHSSYPRKIAIILTLLPASDRTGRDTTAQTAGGRKGGTWRKGEGRADNVLPASGNVRLTLQALKASRPL